jgi:hypothetical protein
MDLGRMWPTADSGASGEASLGDWKSHGLKLKQLEDENRKLKHVGAELTLDNRALKDVLSKNW